tara:strand:+ start:4877 stop:6025 length:1149 start_codon:yes stop_codon:yes gene_type:complete
MEQILQHVALPNNDLGIFKEYDNIDFTLEFDNRTLMCEELRFECDIQVYEDAGTTRTVSGKDIYLDPKVGGHSIISSINTTLSNIGNIENLTDYNRLVKMKSDAVHTYDDMMNSDKVCELKAPDSSIQALQLCQLTPKIFGGGGPGKSAQSVLGAVDDPDMSLKLQFCLNQVVVGSNKRISYSTSGAVRIRIILERNLGVLCGSDVVDASIYTITNPRIRFMTAPDQSPLPVQLNCALSLKQSLETAFNNLSCNVPAVCHAVSLSFLQSQYEYVVNRNNLQLAQPPGVSQVSYLFNDATNKYVTYQIKNQVEMISRGLESLNTQGSNSLNLTRLSSNKGYLLGLEWNSDVSLANQKFNIQLSTDINFDNYVMFSYFHSIVSV